MAGSDVAKLMEQIALEHEAAIRALTSFSTGAATHEFITKRMETIGAYHEQLSVLIGPEAAIQKIAVVMEGPTR